MPDFILAIDQGTTSARSIVFDRMLAPVAIAQQEFPQLYPAPGLVEHDPEAIWSSTLATMREAIGRAGIKPSQIAAIGIANQRETTVVWERASGRPIHHAIVWQDRRTTETCAALARNGHEPLIAARTGLLLDPYFSATKIAWLLDHVEGARRRHAPASSPSAPSTASCSGGSPAARSTPRTRPTRRARCFWISTAAAGTASSASSWPCRHHFCRKYAIVRVISAPPMCLARRSPSVPCWATSRRQP